MHGLGIGSVDVDVPEVVVPVAVADEENSVVVDPHGVGVGDKGLLAESAGGGAAAAGDNVAEKKIGGLLVLDLVPDVDSGHKVLVVRGHRGTPDTRDEVHVGGGEGTALNRGYCKGREN